MEIPKDYPLVGAVAIAMNWHMMTQGVAAGKFRSKLFNQDFMDKEFGQVHEK